MKRILLILPLAVSALLAGCSNPADGLPEAKGKAVTNAAPNPSAAAQTPANAKPFAFGPDSSSIDFIGSKVTGSHKGGFKNFVGEFQVADGKLASTGHKVIIDTGSLFSDSDRLTGHLKSKDFFDVATHPTATFMATAVQQTGTNVTVTGQLTLHGITKEITFPAKVAVSDQGVEVEALFALNRFDFDMKYAGKADDLIRKEVALHFKVKAVPGKASFEKLQKPPPTA